MEERLEVHYGLDLRVRFPMCVVFLSLPAILLTCSRLLSAHLFLATSRCHPRGDARYASPSRCVRQATTSEGSSTATGSG